MKRIIAVLVVLSLLVFSASAAGVYEVEPDTVVMSQPVSSFSLNSTVSPLATGSDYSQDIYNLLVAEFDTNSLFMQFLRNIDQHTFLSQTYLASLVSNLDIVKGFLTVSSGQTILGSNGLSQDLSSDVSLSSLVQHGFLGLKSISVLPSGSWFLGSQGVPSPNSLEYSFSGLITNGFLGIRSLISGTEAYSNEYQVTVVGPDETSTTQSVVGLGPMIRHYLEAIQGDVATLAFVLGDADDRDAKESSSGFLKAITSNFLKSDSKGSLNSGSVSDLKGVSDGAADLFDSGYGVSDFFTELDNDSDFMSWFSAETATALDSSAQAVFIDDEDPYDMSYYYEQLALIQSKRGEDTND